MDEIIQLVSAGVKDRMDTGDKVLSLLPAVIDSSTDHGAIEELAQGLQLWVKSSNTKALLRLAPLFFSNTFLLRYARQP